MIWKMKQSPRIGDTRIRRRFALIPTRVGNYWVWLQWYFVQEEFCRYVVDDVVPYVKSGWRHTRRWIWGAGAP